jgi:hypothetical protein
LGEGREGCRSQQHSAAHWRWQRSAEDLSGIMRTPAEKRHRDSDAAWQSSRTQTHDSPATGLHGCTHSLAKTSPGEQG